MTMNHSTLERNCSVTSKHLGKEHAASHAQPSDFNDATRIQRSVSAGLEGRVLPWFAERIPAWVNSDHLTVLGFASMFFAGCSYALARWNRIGLMLATVCLVLNWFGDSLDGTLARVRNCQRPRYGFYVDHVIDSFGAVFLMSGLAISGYVARGIAVGMLVTFLMLSIEVYLAAYTIGIFRISFWKLGPTEIRILLSLANTALWLRGDFRVLGPAFHLFDIGGVVAIAGMGGMLISSVISHTRRLYLEEKLLTVDRSCTPPFSPLRGDSRSSKSIFVRILFSLIVSAALVCVPKLAFAQHGGRGSRGGGGVHGSGAHRSSRGFHGSGGGHFGGGGSRSGMSAALPNRNSRWYHGSSGFASLPSRNSGYVGNRWAGPHDSRSINITAGNRLGMAPGTAVRLRPPVRVRHFGDAGAGRPAASDFGNRMSGWRSFENPGSRRPASTARSYGSAMGGWHSFGPQDRAERAIAVPFAHASGQWHSFGSAGNSSVAGAVTSMNFGSNRPTRGFASGSWSGQGNSFWANRPGSTSSFSSGRGLSNFGNPRYGNSAFGHSPFFNPRIGSNVSLFGSSRFRSTPQFDRGASFGGGGFSFASDLFSSLLGFGGFGLRGLGLLGSGFGLLRSDILPWFGLGWLFGPEFGSGAGPGATCGAPYAHDQSENWDSSPCSIPYSTQDSPSNY